MVALFFDVKLVAPRERKKIVRLAVGVAED